MISECRQLAHPDNNNTVLEFHQLRLKNEMYHKYGLLSQIVLLCVHRHDRRILLCVHRHDGRILLCVHRHDGKILLCLLIKKILPDQTRLYIFISN